MINLLEIMAYLIIGTVAIAWAASWLLKHLGPRK